MFYFFDSDSPHILQNIAHSFVLEKGDKVSIYFGFQKSISQICRLFYLFDSDFPDILQKSAHRFVLQKSGEGFDWFSFSEINCSKLPLILFMRFRFSTSCNKLHIILFCVIVIRFTRVRRIFVFRDQFFKFAAYFIYSVNDKGMRSDSNIVWEANQWICQSKPVCGVCFGRDCSFLTFIPVECNFKLLIYLWSSLCLWISFS